MIRLPSAHFAFAVAILAAAQAGCAGEGSSLIGAGGGTRVEIEEHLQSGMEMMRQGMDEAAEAEFRRCIALDPKDGRAHLQLGRLLSAQAFRARAAPRESAQELGLAVELLPRDLQARYELADTLRQPFMNLHDPERAVELYEGILKENPALAEIRLRYAIWLTKGDVRLSVQGKTGRVTKDSAWTMDAARHHLERVIDQVPVDGDLAAMAHAAMTVVLMRSGLWPELVRECDLTLERYQNIPLEKRAEVLWTKGQGLYRQGLYKEAIAVYRQEFDLLPGDRPCWDIFQCSLKMGGFPAGLPEKYRFPVRQEEAGQDLPRAPGFRDRARELGVDKFAGAGPASWGDYDGDGRLDLFVCGCDTFCSLYRNEGERFRDVTLAAGLDKVESGFGAPWGDFDGDGRPDLYIARNGWAGIAPDTLLRNKGDGSFEDVTGPSGIVEPGSGFHATWLDYNRDGWLDLFVSNGVTLDRNINHLYRNRGNGTFEDATAAAGLKEEVRMGTIGAAVGDFDGDGWPDLFINGRREANRLYRNRGDGTFEERGRSAGVEGNGRLNGFVALASDFDSDGDLDILSTSLAGWDSVLAGLRSDYRPVPDDDLPRLYRNEGGGRFIDVSDQAGFVYPLGVMAADAGDIDNDGYLDIYFGTGDPDARRLEPNYLYMNTGRGAFVDRSRSAGVWSLGKGHRVTFIDWDGDGDLEIYAQKGGFFHGDLWHSAFFINDSPKRNHYLAVDLLQDSPNRLAVGAAVTVEAGSLKIYQEETAGRGFGSSDPPTLHFGLGRNARIDRLLVRWPDGSAQEVPPPPVDRRILIRRGEKSWTDAPAPRSGR